MRQPSKIGEMVREDVNDEQTRFVPAIHNPLFFNIKASVPQPFQLFHLRVQEHELEAKRTE